jgi:pyruvate/2-oxoacid:ferredoxin oxidoreductase alpha subunit
MSRFQRTFGIWFATLMGFFLLANVAGAVRQQDLLPFRYTGFPFSFAAWGDTVEEFFDWAALALNAAIAVAASGLVATVCAWTRTRHRVEPSSASKPGNTPNPTRNPSLPSP